MCSPKAPSAPNPTQTAAAQTQSNISTAIGQQQLNAVNQVTPWGNLTYSQNGTYDYVDPSTGKTYKLPKMTATTTLSPDQLALYNTSSATQQNLANVAKDQSVRLGDLLAEPFSLDNDAVEGRINELASKRLDPQLAQKREATIQRLADQGIKVGSAAYDRAIALADQGENDARNSLLLSGRNQAVQEALLARNQPLNEIIGLASGTQVQTPQFASTPQTALAGTDVAGITQQGYQNALAQYGQQQQQLGGLFGTIGSVAGAALPFILSDKRAKTDIHETGDEINEIPVVTYRYKGDNRRRVGFLAQDVLRERPGAVRKRPDGLLEVNYAKAVA